MDISRGNIFILQSGRRYYRGEEIKGFGPGASLESAYKIYHSPFLTGSPVGPDIRSGIYLKRGMLLLPERRKVEPPT